MNAVFIGMILGTFGAPIVVPVILLIIFKLTPLKRRPKVSYGIVGSACDRHATCSDFGPTRCIHHCGASGGRIFLLGLQSRLSKA